MVKNWLALADDLSKAVGQLHAGIPDVMKAFRSVDAAATAAGALNEKTKELMALALAVATRCDGCIAFHARACVKYGATRAEVMETVGMAVVMGGGPSVMYGSLAVEAFDQFMEKKAAEPA